MFHVELRQFPHQARAFNLTREQLEGQILASWVSGTPVEFDDRRWSPERAKLTIYEGPPLAPEELGLGRGWANVTRAGEDVTARILAEMARPPAVTALKRETLELCAGEAVSLGRLVDLTGEHYPQARVSDRIALCERAVWELLHEGAVALRRGGQAVHGDEWQAVLLEWETWRAGEVTLERG